MHRLNRNDRAWLTLAAAVALVSLWFTHQYFHKAFAQASIDFQVSGSGSQPIAEMFLEARGLATAGYRHAEQFGYDDEAKTFLERELGLERAQTLFNTRVRLWQWQNRWFLPLTKQEFRVDVTTAGVVDGFDHTIADEAPGGDVGEAAARARAEALLTGGMHMDLSTLVPVSTEREVKPNRVDYLFTWKDAAPLVAGATGDLAQAEYRYEVRVQGGEVGAYHEYLKIPDQWIRDYEHLRSRNETTGSVDAGLMLVLLVGMLVVLVRRIRRGDVRWRTALWVGGTGAVLSFLADMNQFGAAQFNYNTTSSYGAFLATTLFGAVATAVGIGLLLLVLTAAAETLYRDRFPEKVAVPRLLTRAGLRSKSFFLSMALGLALAAFFFAYQTGFYLVANHFGAWAPADVPYDDLLNTRLPWAFVLFSGFFPAISEEFGFRMLAIPLFEKWFRYLWVAILAASFLWGFGHATYPNQPFYIRGVEVGLGGILLSWVMIRFGILTTVVWHYTVDAVYTAMLLLRAHDPYLRASGGFTAFLAVLPLLVAGWAYWKTGTFSDETPLRNAAENERSAPEPAPEPLSAAAASVTAERGRPHEAISGQSWTTGILVAVALLGAFAVPLAHWDSSLPWKLSRADAVARARAFLMAQGANPAGYTAVAEVGTPDEANGENQVAAADIFAAQGRRSLMLAFSGPPPTVVAEYWRVRFFEPLREEEYEVAVRPDTGQITGWLHQVPETAPGASPGLAQAQGIAAAFLSGQGIDVTGMALKTATSEKKAARTDSDFVWERENGSPLAGEVNYRVEAHLAGDQVDRFVGWYHVPEQRLRDYNQNTMRDIVLLVIRALLYAGGSILVLVYFFGFARKATQSWGTLIRISLAAAAVMMIVAWNMLPTSYFAYDTSTPLSAFLVTEALSVGGAGLVGFLLTLGLLAPLAITAPQAAALTRANARRQLERETAWDAAWVGMLALGWMMGWARVQAVIGSRWHDAAQPPLPAPPAGLGAHVPGLNDLLNAPLHALWYGAFLGILLPVTWSWWRDRRLRPFAVGAAVLLWLGNLPTLHSPHQLGQAMLFGAIGVALLFGFAHLFLRDNPFAYLNAILLPSLVLPGLNWLTVDTGGAQTAGYVLLAAAAIWLLWLALVSRKPKAATTR